MGTDRLDEVRRELGHASQLIDQALASPEPMRVLFDHFRTSDEQGKETLFMAVAFALLVADRRARVVSSSAGSLQCS